jgi:hypothetical protein
MIKMDNPCDGCLAEYCYLICGKCSGKGVVLDIVVGLGVNGLLPSYAEIICPRCGGQGTVYRCPYY